MALKITEWKVDTVKTGMTQIELAKRAGIQRTRLNMILNGWLNPKPEEIQRIKDVLSEAE